MPISGLEEEEEMFKQTLEAMTIMGFTPDEQACMYHS
jgi:myosin heavy subunit